MNTIEIAEAEPQPMEIDDSDSNSTDYPSGWEDSDQMAPQIMFIPRQIPGDQIMSMHVHCKVLYTK